jgi:CRISPR-associated protein Cas5
MMIMENLDLSFYLEPPELTVEGVLKVSALAPLSMVSAQPGTYFRTELTPPVNMIYGVLENVLGWHLPDKIRKEVLKGLAKKAKKLHGKDARYKGSSWLSGKSVTSAKSKYFSLLQYHLEVGAADVPKDLMTYDDLWSMHLRDRGMNYIGGSRIYDHRLEGLITTLRSSSSEFRAMDSKEAKDRASEKYEVGDRKEFVRIPLKELYATEERKINAGSLGEGYPMYYVSPKVRGFVVTDVGYELPVKTTPEIARLLEKHLDSPVSPPYLGTSEGWIDIKWNANV